MSVQGPVAPGVSVVIAVRDGERYLAETLESLHAQSFRDFEVVVVDDGSNDRTPDILERFRRQCETAGRRVSIVRQSASGAARARNAGLERAGGELVVFCDADDRCHPELLDAVISGFRSGERPSLVFPRVRHVDSMGTPTGVTSARPRGALSYLDLLVANPIHSTSGTTVRRQDALAVGGFDETLEAVADLDFAIRIGQAGPGRIVGLDRVLVDYRRHVGQMTANWRRIRANWERVFEKARRARPAEVDAVRNRAYAMNGVYWATLAYQSGDYPSSRRLIAEAWGNSPLTLAGNAHALVRSLACATSLLPLSLHVAIRRAVHKVERKPVGKERPPR